jgi:hypothetical protein
MTRSGECTLSICTSKLQQAYLDSISKTMNTKPASRLISPRNINSEVTKRLDSNQHQPQKSGLDNKTTRKHMANKDQL